VVATNNTTATWDKTQRPVTVLFSPNLRLRYIAVVGQCIKHFNKNEVLFKEPTTANHKLALDVEIYGEAPPSGSIYIEDDCSDTTEASISYFVESSRLYSIVIKLPESETSPYILSSLTSDQLLKALT
jgi:hypothetical protein